MLINFVLGPFIMGVYGTKNYVSLPFIHLASRIYVVLEPGQLSLMVKSAGSTRPGLLGLCYLILLVRVER